MERHVLKSGNLSLQTKGFMKTTWVDRFCVLYSKSVDSHPYMEFYESKSAFQNFKESGKKTDIKKVELQQVKSIKSSNQSTKGKEEFIIEIKSRSQKVTIMLDSAQNAADWYEKLNSTAIIMDRESGEDSSKLSDVRPEDEEEEEDGDEIVTINQMYQWSEQATRYEVTVDDTPLAKLCDISGRKCLLVSSCDIAFEDPKSKSINYRFSFPWMRRFGKREDSFNIELGRKCPNGEGSLVIRGHNLKALHDELKEKSKSNSSTVTKPHATSVSTNVQKLEGSISGPVIAVNMQRSHPGQRPHMLIPITKPNTEESDPSSPTVDKRNENEKKRNKSSSSKQKTGSDSFSKELEEKLHAGDNSGGKKESVKTKEHKKDEKKEKDKSHDSKKEGKGGFRGFFSGKKDSVKEERKHDSDKEEKKPDKAETKAHPRHDFNAYEDPDDFKKAQTNSDSADMIYDEACSPATSSQQEPVEYAQPIRVSKSSKKSEIYDEAASSKQKRKSAHGKPTQQQSPMEYAEVGQLRNNAWQQCPDGEDNIHEEDYMNIKQAREQMAEAGAPPIPSREYDDDDEDDTYNRLTFDGKKNNPQPQNIYGTASGHEIGPIMPKVPIPQADYSDDSEGEKLYDDPDYDTCGNENVVVNKKPNPPPDQGYEEAEIRNVKPPSKKVVTDHEALYDEVR